MATSTPRTLPQLHIVPPTQNTAPVIEYRCLHTSDIRRKQKRWQDGRLKFHAFNKRVMVYDDRGNFVGDTHWCEDYEFDEGLEVELERSGVLVQVSECMGRRDQDLSELWDKQQKERGEKYSRTTAVSSSSRPSGSILRRQPYILPQPNVRQYNAAKRRRPDDSPPTKKGYAQNLTGALLTLSGKPPGMLAVRYDTSWKGTFRQSIENVDLAYSPPIKASRNTMIANSDYEEMDKRGIRRKLVRSSLEPSDASHTERPSGTAFILNKKAVNRIGFNKDDNSEKICDNTFEEPTIQEDHFIDIDVYSDDTTQNATVLNTTQHVKPDKGPVVVQPKKSQLLPHRTMVRSVDGGWSRYDKPINPLRIKPRSKRKLLLVAQPQTHLSAIVKHIESKDYIKVDLPVLHEENEVLSKTERATIEISPFQEQKQRSTRATSSRSCVTSKHLPPETGRLDHLTIDAKLSCNTSGLGRIENHSSKGHDIAGLLNASTAVEKFGDGIPRLKLDLHPLDDSIAQCLLSFQSGTEGEQMNGQCVQKSTVEDDSNSANRACLEENASRKVKNVGLNEETLRSRDSYSLVNTDLSTNYSKSLHLPTAITKLKTMADLTKSQLLLSNASTQATKSTMEYGQPIALPISVISVIKNPRQGKDSTREELGPWSREAFDLFDWRPGLRN